MFDEWNKIILNQIRDRISDMPRRCRILTENGGAAIKGGTEVIGRILVGCGVIPVNIHFWHLLWSQNTTKYSEGKIRLSFQTWKRWTASAEWTVRADLWSERANYYKKPWQANPPQFEWSSPNRRKNIVCLGYNQSPRAPPVKESSAVENCTFLVHISSLEAICLFCLDRAKFHCWDTEDAKQRIVFYDTEEQKWQVA
jgi:hypothetical protein